MNQEVITREKIDVLYLDFVELGLFLGCVGTKAQIQNLRAYEHFRKELHSATSLTDFLNGTLSYDLFCYLSGETLSKEFRPYKQMIERFNRTYKASYRPTNGFDNYDGANYDLTLWVAYYNFLRPHKHTNYAPLNKVDMLANSENMPGKWQLLILLGQQTILNLQAEGSNCS